jgi:hypothetical protein
MREKGGIVKMDKNIKYVTENELTNIYAKSLEDPECPIPEFNVSDGYVKINGKKLRLIKEE